MTTATTASTGTDSGGTFKKSSIDARDLREGDTILMRPEGSARTRNDMFPATVFRLSRMLPNGQQLVSNYICIYCLDPKGHVFDVTVTSGQHILVLGPQP